MAFDTKIVSLAYRFNIHMQIYVYRHHEQWKRVLKTSLGHSPALIISINFYNLFKSVTYISLCASYIS